MQISKAVRLRTPSAPATAPTPANESSLSVLERRHPAVIQTLRLLWGYPELNQYFEKVYSGRDASLNLAPDAMAELMVLASVHQRICPQRPAATVQELYGSSRLVRSLEACAAAPLTARHCRIPRSQRSYIRSATRFIRCVRLIQVQNDFFRALHTDTALTFERSSISRLPSEVPTHPLTSDGVIST